MFSVFPGSIIAKYHISYCFLRVTSIGFSWRRTCPLLTDQLLNSLAASKSAFFLVKFQYFLSNQKFSNLAVQGMTNRKSQ